MNKPIQPPIADHDIGPLDEHGQQIWSAEEEAASARMDADPVCQAELAEAEAQIERGEWFTTEQVNAFMRERKREWFAERGRTPPQGYFDN